MVARGKHSWEQTKWWEQVTTQPTYSGSLTALSGSHPAQLEEAGAPKSAALQLLLAWEMLALEIKSLVQSSMKDSYAIEKTTKFLQRFFKNVWLG